MTGKPRTIGLFASAAALGVAAAAFQVTAAEPPATPPPSHASPATTLPTDRKPAVEGKPATEPKFSATDLDFFEKQVRPLLAEQCFKCHNDKKQKGGLRLDARSLVLKGGDHGPSVDLVAPDKSVLLKAVNYADSEMEMPPSGKLPQAQIDV